jgi:hypothetical protein
LVAALVSVVPGESGDPVITESVDTLQYRNTCSGILGPRFRGDDAREVSDAGEVIYFLILASIGALIVAG